MFWQPIMKISINLKIIFNKNNIIQFTDSHAHIIWIIMQLVDGLKKNGIKIKMNTSKKDNFVIVNFKS